MPAEEERGLTLVQTDGKLGVERMTDVTEGAESHGGAAGKG